MRLSVITVAYNSAGTIEETLGSVAWQTSRDIEHIVVDGVSTDGMADIVRSFGHVARFISEPDRGIYDAMSKGLPQELVRMRTGGTINGTVRGLLLKSREDLRVIRRNSIGGLFTLACKSVRKLPQFLGGSDA